MIRAANINDAGLIARIRVDGWTTAYKGLIPEAKISGISFFKKDKRFIKCIHFKHILISSTIFKSLIFVYKYV